MADNLNNLNPTFIKVKLVSRKDKNVGQPANDDNWVLQFSGSWKDFPESAEDLIELVESARTDSSRAIEVL
ncbi:MAG: hypothetical protein WCR52_15240 [Bacteroidota bacterium]